tara:strand:- start:206 stop:991 length:786 start_codon:yes stop_codon:yes gene_type:complete
MVGSIQQFVKNKNILFVGNSVEIMQHKLADVINKYDIVVRFGKAIEANKLHEESIGTKCDIWVTGQFRAPCYNNLREDFETGRFKNTKILVNRSRGNFRLKDWKIEEHLPEGMKYSTMYEDDEIINIMRSFNRELFWTDDLRPSAGFITLLWFINEIKTYKSITLIGFDFFSKRINKRPIDKQGRLGMADPHSWHLPCYMREHSAHDSELEKQYVGFLERRGLINWMLLSDLSNEEIKYTDWMKGMRLTKSINKRTKVSKI